MSRPAPAGWTTVSLGDIGDALIGLTYQPSSVRRFGTLVLRSSNIQDDELSFKDNVYVDSSIPERIRVRDGDILICVRNGSRRLIGKSARLDERVVGETFGAFMAVFRSDANEYLHYYFQSDAFKRQVDQHLGATINQITNASLKSFTVALPPLDERSRIAGHLRDATALVSALKTLLTKKKAMKQGMAQRLLNGETRLPGFAGARSESRVGDLGVLLRGRGIKRDDVRTGGVACVRYGEIYTSFDTYTSQSVSYVSPQVAATALTLRRGDLLFAASGETHGEIGKCVAYLGEEPAVAGGDTIVLRARGVHPVYLAMALNSQDAANQKSRLSQGETVVHISRAGLGSIRVQLPPVDEQSAVAKVFIDADAEIQALRRRLTKAMEIKDGLMHQLLTGRVRLREPETVA